MLHSEKNNDSFNEPKGKCEIRNIWEKFLWYCFMMFSFSISTKRIFRILKFDNTSTNEKCIHEILQCWMTSIISLCKMLFLKTLQQFYFGIVVGMVYIWIKKNLKMKRNISLYHFTCHLFDNRNSSFTKTFHPRFQNGFIIIFYCKTHYTNEFVFIQWSRKFKLKILLHYFLCNSWVSFANEKNFGQFQVMKLSNFMCSTSY